MHEYSPGTGADNPLGCMPSFKIIGFLVWEKKLLKVFSIYGRGGHLDHVT